MDQEKFGKLIKKIRKENNLTQKDLADKYNVTYQAVSKWENGKNMPDISLIKEISNDFNIEIDDMLDGIDKKKTKKRSFIIIILLGIIFIMLVTFLIVKGLNNNFEFKTISSNCSNFNISGSISYNDSKSSIYISNIEYCGGDDKKEYENITCNLYEQNNNVNVLIDSCSNSNKNVTLENYLKDVSFVVDNYSKVCKEYSKNSLYLEIEATDKNGKTTKYKVPLEMDDNC